MIFKYQVSFRDDNTCVYNGILWLVRSFFCVELGCSPFYLSVMFMLIICESNFPSGT